VFGHEPLHVRSVENDVGGEDTTLKWKVWHGEPEGYEVGGGVVGHEAGSF